MFGLEGANKASTPRSGGCGCASERGQQYVARLRIALRQSLSASWQIQAFIPPELALHIFVCKFVGLEGVGGMCQARPLLLFFEKVLKGTTKPSFVGHSFHLVLMYAFVGQASTLSVLGGHVFGQLMVDDHGKFVLLSSGLLGLVHSCTPSEHCTL